MKRSLYYLLCAIACTSMVSATMPMAAIAEAIQPPATAEQQAQADTTSSDTGKAEGGTDTNVTADTVEDSTATSTGTSVVNTERAAGTTTATDTATTAPTPSLLAQANPTPAAISATSQSGYAHSATATQNGVTFTVSWNYAPAGTAATFHVTQANGSSQAKARMDVPTYWDGGSHESVCDPSRPAWASYYSLGTAGHDFTFDFTASGTYRIYFYFMDNDRNDPQNDKGIYYLRTTAEVTVNDAARPSVTQIVNDAVAQCRQQTNGSEYDMALRLHDWTLDQLEYDHSLNWCSAESGLTRHQGTCESYQRIYSKLLDAAGIANGRITGNGHTWNAVKIDGKWCQMDLTWDDTSDNWYGDLDQRHLYFGLTTSSWQSPTPTTRSFINQCMKYELNFKTDEGSQAPSTYAWLLYNKCMDLFNPEQYRIEYWANELARNEGARKAAFEFFSKDAIKAKDAREQARILYNILAGITNPTEYQLSYWTKAISANGLKCSVDEFCKQDLFKKQCLLYNIRY